VAAAPTLTVAFTGEPRSCDTFAEREPRCRRDVGASRHTLRQLGSGWHLHLRPKGQLSRAFVNSLQLGTTGWVVWGTEGPGFESPQPDHCSQQMSCAPGRRSRGSMSEVCRRERGKGQPCRAARKRSRGHTRPLPESDRPGHPSNRHSFSVVWEFTPGASVPARSSGVGVRSFDL